MEDKTTLYKRGRNDKIQVWTIEVHEGKYRSTEGFEDGAMTTSEWTQAIGKNIGKKNETSVEVQARNQAASKIREKLEKGWFAKKEEVDGEKVFGVQLAYEYSKKYSYVEKALLANGVYIQPKLDGIRCYVNKEGMFSKENKPIISAPHIFESVKHIFDEYPDLVLDGELYNHKLKNDFNKITSLVKKKKPTPEDLEESKNLVEFHVFDLYENDTDIFSTRSRRLIELCEDLPHIVIVLTEKASDVSQIDGEYFRFMEDGYEGGMIRIDAPYDQKRTTSILKRKEFQDSEFEIVDVIEGVGNRSGMFGKFMLKTETGSIFGCNARGNEEYYKEILKNKSSYIGKHATVRFQNLTPNGIPRFPVCVAVRDYE